MFSSQKVILSIRDMWNVRKNCKQTYELKSWLYLNISLFFICFLIKHTPNSKYYQNYQNYLGAFFQSNSISNFTCQNPIHFPIRTASLTSYLISLKSNSILPVGLDQISYRVIFDYQKIVRSTFKVHPNPNSSSWHHSSGPHHRDLKFNLL